MALTTQSSARTTVRANTWYGFAKKLPTYCRRFGYVRGIVLAMSVERSRLRGGQTAQAICVPGLRSPVWLREIRGDHATFWQVLVQHQYSLAQFPQTERLMRSYQQLVRDGRRPLIIDGGGNIGLSAIWFAEAFPEAVVCSVEPDTSNVQILRKNLEQYGDRIVIVEGGIWHRASRLKVINPDAGPAAFRVAEIDPGNAGGLAGYSIDDLCRRCGADAPFIVKLDVEGAQEMIFSARTEWVERTHLVMLELDDWLLPWRGTSRNFFETLARTPFDYLIRGETIFCYRDFQSAGRAKPEASEKLQELS